MYHYSSFNFNQQTLMDRLVTNLPKVIDDFIMVRCQGKIFKIVRMLENVYFKVLIWKLRLHRKRENNDFWDSFLFVYQYFFSTLFF